MSTYMNTKALRYETSDRARQRIELPITTCGKAHEKLDSEEDTRIEWSNLIFLPFHPLFRLIVLISVIIKTTLGPLNAVYPIMYCWDIMDRNIILLFLKYIYGYAADTIYCVDMFLHIIHRQVTDKAMRREFIPKSAFLLLLDLISMIPFYRLMTPATCPPAQLWPNLLAFNEFLVLYRVWEYFNLISTHSYLKLTLGFTIITLITINCATTFWVLLTYEGLCGNCNKFILDYDWRAYIKHKLNETDVELATYVYATSFVTTHLLREVIDKTLPSTILEFTMTCLLMLAGYVVQNTIVVPKFFAESVLSLLGICNKYPAVQKVIEETKRRNPSHKAYRHVETYYTIMWKRRNGIVHMPDIFQKIPRYLRLEISQDLLWPLFHHSPTLRQTSCSLKRWLSEFVLMSYKLPGEKFYGGRSCLSNFYYLKSGVVQLISADDGTTPILSVTSGTIFGDVNFLLPHKRRKVALRCLTYSEVYCLPRCCILRGLYRFPEDRKIIMNSFKDRINHAKGLFERKNQVRGLDRNEDEGLAWLKKRWWEIFEAVNAWKKKTAQIEFQLPDIKLELPREVSLYHCAKYVGQLVLCTESQLQTKSMFVNDRFPWILSPYSTFHTVWKKVVVVSVFIALCTYPPHIVMSNMPSWFHFTIFWSNMIYVADLCVSLSTAVSIQENEIPTFASVVFERCKTFKFILDVISSICIEEIVKAINQPSLYYPVQFNRLVKIYVLLSSNWDIRKNPLMDVLRKMIIIYFTFLTTISHIVYVISNYYPQLTISSFFGERLCTNNNVTSCGIMDPLLGVVLPWTYELIFPENLPLKQIDTYIAIVTGYVAYIIYAYCKCRFLAFVYLTNRNARLYEYLVKNLGKFCQHYRINKDLLKRLERYFVCQYKYYKGVDVINPDWNKEEPFEICWKVQGEVAEKIIGESKPFKHTDPALVRELACAAKYLILPKNATLFLFGYHCANATWVVQGYVKSEYLHASGEVDGRYYGPGDMLATCPVMFRTPTFKTYTTYTECEILYIKTQEFFKIYKQNQLEWQFLQTATQEFKSEYEKLAYQRVANHKEYRVSIREKMQATGSGMIHPKLSEAATVPVAGLYQDKRSSPLEGMFWGQPESGFLQSWLLFRAITVFVSITNASLQGGTGSLALWPCQMIGAFCDCIAWTDITLKLFVDYYDKRGILITDRIKCFKNYLSKGFILDIIGALPWFQVLKILLSKEIDANSVFLINTICKFAHIYIVFAYFNYISDLPTVNVIFIKIIKWQVVNILIVMGASHYLMSNCFHYTIDDNMSVLKMKLRNDCWIPPIFTLPDQLDTESLHLIFVQSINLAQCGMMRMNHGGFIINRESYGLFFILCLLGVMFWFMTCYTIILLVLASRENRIFQHGVNSLKTFLLNERVDKMTIDKAVLHFRYYWMRSKGINSDQMKSERFGEVFRQDLTYFFYKKTYAVLDTLLKAGKGIQRLLADESSVHYFLPGHEIMREMDLVPNLFVVHRGKVILKKNGKKIITLTKGDIFGQLVGTRLRPVKVSAEALDHVDVLQLSVKTFQEIISPQVRENIAENPQARNDFMATKDFFIENPYDTVEYIVRGKKAIQLPWMREIKEAHHYCWYSAWLQITWFCGPCFTAFIVPLLPWYALPPQYVKILYFILFILDILHLANFITEFYSVILVVENNKCVKRKIGCGLLKTWGFYVDALSLILPLFTLVHNDRRFQLARLLRLKWFIDFEFNFCQGFKSKTAPRVLKTFVYLLLIHFFTCGWIYVGCSNEKFPIHVPDFKQLNASIDYGEWIHPDQRNGGCARATRDIIKKGNKTLPAFVVPVFWAHDYIVALTYILLIHTHSSLDSVMAITIKQVYYKIFVTLGTYLVNIWLLATMLSAVYTKMRDLYQYDYLVSNLITFLKDSGLCPSLSKTVQEYTNLLWKKDKGVWLPQIAYQAPICLREDLFVALYMHHLNAAASFRQLPYYFKRQLAARFERTVIFPGKCIVHEGDVFNVTYFIHEGEVEKWYKDASGEGKMMSLLYTNGYFGCIPGLFLDSAFQFSYYTRTVVDLVYLRLTNWQDLLDGYPEIKNTIQESTRVMKQEVLRNRQCST